MKQARVDRDRAKGKAEKTADAKREKIGSDRAATGTTAPERKPEQPKQKY